MEAVKIPEELNRFLRERQLEGLWNIQSAERPHDPKTTVKPYLWKWADIHAGLIQARDQIGVKSGALERRVIYLVNPGMRDTSHTVHVAFQLIQPGEVAPPHRHTMAAIRFILHGKGACTTVEGRKMVMEEGDLILTPQWTWHEHANDGVESMIWMDVLDLPLIQALQVISFEPYPGERIPLKEVPDMSPHYGMTRPVESGAQEEAPPLHYRWREIYPSLRRLAEDKPDPFEGAALAYVNPVTGGPTLPTLSCWMQLLRPRQRTKVHRHTSTVVYHVFRGRGMTVVNGQPIEWEQGDTFVVPLWHWHEHANRSSSDEAILYSINDAPVLKAFGLYREERRGETHLGL